MKNRLCIAFLLFLALLMSSSVFSQVEFHAPNWDRGMASKVIQTSDTDAVLAPLFQLAREGNADSVLAALEAVRQNPTLQGPAADFIMFSFTIGLSDLDAGTLDGEIIETLASYQPATLVAHDDNAAIGVPLFNVRAAAAGVKVAWDRQAAAIEAGRLDPDQPEQWIEHYLAANSTSRRGFTDSLAQWSPDQLVGLGQATARQLPVYPDLTVVTATAGLQSGDLELVWQSIESGDPSQLPAVLRAAATQLSAVDAGILLDRSFQLDSVTSKSLAIAQLGPVSLTEHGARESLFESLESRELGAGAALVLSSSADPQIVERLNRIAQTHEGLAQQRANLAIQLNRTQRETER